MKEYGLDLSSYKHAKAQARAIYDRLKEDTVPCDGAWPENADSLVQGNG
jgi:hypothetical protein